MFCCYDIRSTLLISEKASLCSLPSPTYFWDFEWLPFEPSGHFCYPHHCTNHAPYSSLLCFLKKIHYQIRILWIQIHQLRDIRLFDNARWRTRLPKEVFFYDGNDLPLVLFWPCFQKLQAIHHNKTNNTPGIFQAWNSSSNINHLLSLKKFIYGRTHGAPTDQSTPYLFILLDIRFRHPK